MKERVARGQSGIEFLAVTGLGLLLVLGVSLFLLGQSKTERDDAASQQVAQTQNALLQQAQTVWSLGRNSWVTVDATLPSTVSDILIADNSLIVVSDTSGGRATQVLFSPVPIGGAVRMGDVTSDGATDAADAAQITSYLAGGVTLTTAQLHAGDVDGDGMVTAKDAQAITDYVGGSGKILPAQSVFTVPRIGPVSIKVFNNGTTVVFSVQ